MSCDFGLVGFLGQGEELNFYMIIRKTRVWSLIEHLINESFGLSNAIRMVVLIVCSSILCNAVYS